MRSNPPPSHGRSEHLQAWKVERATLPCSSAGTSHTGVGLGEHSFPVQGGQVLYLNYQGPTHMQEVYLLCSSSGTSTEVTSPCPEPGHRAMMAAWISLPPGTLSYLPPCHRQILAGGTSGAKPTNISSFRVSLASSCSTSSCDHPHFKAPFTGHA